MTGNSLTRKYRKFFSKETEKVWKAWINAKWRSPGKDDFKKLATDGAYADGIRARALYVLSSLSEHSMPFYWTKKLSLVGGLRSKDLKEVVKTLPSELVEYLADLILYFHQTAEDYEEYNLLLLTLTEVLQKDYEDIAKKVFSQYDLRCFSHGAIWDVLRNKDLEQRWIFQADKKMQNMIASAMLEDGVLCIDLLGIYFKSIQTAISRNNNYSKELLVDQTKLIIEIGEAMGWYPPNPVQIFTDFGDFKFTFNAFKELSNQDLEKFCLYVLVGNAEKIMENVDHMEVAELMLSGIKDNSVWSNFLKEAIQNQQEKDDQREKSQDERKTLEIAALNALKNS